MFGSLSNDELEAYNLFKTPFGAGNISASDHRSALNTLVKDYKVYGLWSKMTTIYPFAGNTSVAQALNLKDTSSFRMTWNGGMTHSLSFVKGNGVNAYGNTGLTPTSSFPNNNAHMSIWSSGSNTQVGTDFGIGDGVTEPNVFYIEMKQPDNNCYFGAYSFTEAGGSAHVTVTNIQYAMFSRTAVNSLIGYINGSASISNVTSVTRTNCNYSPVLLCREHTSSASLTNRPYSIATMGTGLTSAEASASYYIANRWVKNVSRI